MTDEDFIKMWNEVSKEVKTPQSLIQDAVSLDQTWQELGYDSLDALMQSVVLCDIYDLTEEDGKGMREPKVGMVKSYLEAHARSLPESLQDALARIN